MSLRPEGNLDTLDIEPVGTQPAVMDDDAVGLRAAAAALIDPARRRDIGDERVGGNVPR